MSTSGLETREEIIYYLRFLNFIKSDVLSNEDYERLIRYVNLEHNQQDDETIINNVNVIEEVVDKMMVIALMRNTKFITSENNALIYNKKQYKFDNVYTSDEYENLITQTVEFTNKRLNACKDTAIVYYGYSGAGKSTLLDRVLSHYDYCSSFKLYEVYLNKLYVYFNGMKIEVKHTDDSKYIFKTTNIRNVMDKFSRKKSNGINSNSSRSHMILELIFDNSKLTCIDLCGNEKSIHKELHEETTFINKSLFNLSRYLALGEKYKEKSCVLLNIIKKTQNILMTVIFNDNENNLAVNHLLLLKDFLKSLYK